MSTKAVRFCVQTPPAVDTQSCILLESGSVKLRHMQQLPALLLLVALCNFTTTSKVQEDAGEFDRLLTAIAECKTSSAKLRVDCIIQQVFTPVDEIDAPYLDWQVEAYAFGEFAPLAMVQRSGLSVGLRKGPGRVSKSLEIQERLYQSAICTRAAKVRWRSRASQRKLLAAGVLPAQLLARQ